MWQSTSSKVGTIFRLSVCDSVHFDKIRSTVLTHIHRMSSGSCFFSGVLSLDSSLRRLRLFTSRDVTVSFLKSSSDLVIVDLFASLISNSMWMSAFRVLSFDSPERQLFNDYSHLGMWQSTLLPSKWEQSFRLSVWDSLHFDKNRSTILTHIHRLSSGSWFFWVLSLDSSHSRLRLFTSRDVTVCSSDLVIVNLPASMIINFVWMSVFQGLIIRFIRSGIYNYLHDSRDVTVSLLPPKWEQCFDCQFGTRFDKIRSTVLTRIHQILRSDSTLRLFTSRDVTVYFLQSWTVRWWSTRVSSWEFFSIAKVDGYQSPTSGAHTHAHGFWVGMGAILLVILLVLLQFLNTWAQFE